MTREDPQVQADIGWMKALIVDDDALIRGVLRQILRSLGCLHVGESRGDDDALAACERERHDIVFLDIALQEANGLDLLQRLLERTPDLFVVMFSGNGTLENVRTAMASGAQGFIVKPFSPAKVEQALRNAAEKKRARERA